MEPGLHCRQDVSVQTPIGHFSLCSARFKETNGRFPRSNDSGMLKMFSWCKTQRYAKKGKGTSKISPEQIKVPLCVCSLATLAHTAPSQTLDSIGFKW